MGVPPGGGGAKRPFRCEWRQFVTVFGLLSEYRHSGAEKIVPPPSSDVPNPKKKGLEHWTKVLWPTTSQKWRSCYSQLFAPPPNPPAGHPYIYYYTPLPLNLANKQQATSKQASKQALLLSVLAIAPPHRSGLYSTLAILEPRCWPCQIQVLSQELTGGTPGRGRQDGRCPPKAAHFVPQNSPFLAQNGPKTQSKRTTEGKRLLHFTCASIAL